MGKLLEIALFASMAVTLLAVAAFNHFHVAWQYFFGAALVAAVLGAMLSFAVRGRFHAREKPQVDPSRPGKSV